MGSTKDFDKLADIFPFLSLVKSGGIEYIGIIQNVDTNVTSVYLYEKIHTSELRKKFLDLGNEWWWETNRSLPIDIVLADRFSDFHNVLTTFSNKDFEIISGPSVSLKDLNSTRSRKKNIQLIKKID